jgi:hypothetical protein
MKKPIALIGLILAAFAGAQEVPDISSTCQIRSLPDQGDGSMVEYLRKITTKTNEDRGLSVDDLTRDPKSPTP